MKKLSFLLIALMFAFAGCEKYETDLQQDFTGHPCIFVYKLANPADIDKVFITVTEKDGIVPEWISPTPDVLFTYKGYVISNTMRYNGQCLYATNIRQVDWDAVSKKSNETLLNHAKFDYKPITECWEWKFQSANLKTLISEIDTGLNSNRFYRKI